MDCCIEILDINGSIKEKITSTVTIDTTGLATSANQTTEISHLASIDTKLTSPIAVTGTVATTGLTDAQLRATPLPVSGTVTTTATNLDIRDLVFATDKVDASGTTLGANSGIDIGDVTINNTSGGSAVNIQDGGNSITVDGPLTDVQLRATPVPVSGTITTTPSGTQNVDVVGNTIGLATSTKQDTGNISLASIDSKLTNPLPISASSLPLPTGAATAALQTQPGVDIGDVTVNNAAGISAVNIQDGGNSITVDGSVTANAGTNLNTSLLALESGGNLAAIKTDVDKIPSQGQAVMAASMPVVIASNQTAIPVTVDTSLLATAAKQDTQITSLASIDAGIPAALGQTTMSASMPVTIASDQSPLVVSVGAIDNTTLYNTPLTVTGAISGILTTGYQSISIQIGGTWIGRVFVEGSNDNTDYSPVFIINLNDLIQQESIYSGGNYTFKVSTKYFRLNVTQLSGTITNTIVGKTGLGVSGIDALSSVMNEDTGVQLSVRETSIKKDSTNALILSDTPKFFDLVQKTGASGVNQVGDIIDTTGYQSIAVYIINAGSGAVMTFQSSHDTFNWTAIQGVTSAGLAASGSSGITASTPLIMFPVMGRYFRINTNGATLARALVYLRQVACPSTNQNIAFISGVAPTSTGITGTIAVGGAIAVGVSGNASNPVIVAGADSTGLVRKILTDTSGRAILSVTDQSQATSGRALGGLAPNNAYNVTSLSVQDTSQFEGQSLIEIAAQLLLEQKITNQYLFELPSVLQRCFATLNDANNKIDQGFKNEPQEFRNDISMFAA